MNRELGAQAFTHGSDIYFGAGKSPGNNDLTAHELTHVVQQTFQVSAKVMRQPSTASAKGISSQSSSEANAVVAKLKLCADTETINRSELTLPELSNAQVGDAWVSLIYNDKNKIPNTIQEPTKGLLKSSTGTAFGFWPLINRGEQFFQDYHEELNERISQGYTPGIGMSTNPNHTGFSRNPFAAWVPGRVEEADNAHSPKITKEYSLNQAQVNSLLHYVNSKRNANYSLYQFNCTTFALESTKQAGQSPPSGSLWGIALPNALYKDLYQMKKKGDKSITVAPLEPGERHENVKK